MLIQKLFENKETSCFWGFFLKKASTYRDKIYTGLVFLIYFLIIIGLDHECTFPSTQQLY